MLEVNNWASESLKASMKLAQLLDGCLVYRSNQIFRMIVTIPKFQP